MGVHTILYMWMMGYPFNVSTSSRPAAIVNEQFAAQYSFLRRTFHHPHVCEPDGNVQQSANASVSIIPWTCSRLITQTF